MKGVSTAAKGCIRRKGKPEDWRMYACRKGAALMREAASEKGIDKG
jgi:hypothetical protein